MADLQRPQQPVQDMFGDDASNSAPKPRRRVAPATPSEPEPERTSGLRRLAPRTVAGIALIIILAGTIAGIAIAQRLRSSKTASQSTSNSNGSTLTTNTANANITLTNLPPEFAADKPKDVTTQDLDHDGLTNLQEVQAGTSPEDPDSDHDGLTDYQEVTVYHTNPLQPDSDHDGFSDGHEVSTGNNPLGSGKLPRS